MQYWLRNTLLNYKKIRDSPIKEDKEGTIIEELTTITKDTYYSINLTESAI